MTVFQQIALDQLATHVGKKRKNSKCIVDSHVKCKTTDLKDTVFIEEYLYSVRLCGRERNFKPNLKERTLKEMIRCTNVKLVLISTKCTNVNSTHQNTFKRVKKQSTE